LWGTLLGPLEGSPGLPFGTRVTAICVPVRFLWCAARPCEPHDDTLSHSRRSAGPRHCWRFSANGRSGPPGSRTFRKVLLPGADLRLREERIDPHPVAGRRRGNLAQRRGGGDKCRSKDGLSPLPAARRGGRGAPQCFGRAGPCIVHPGRGSYYQANSQGREARALGKSRTPFSLETEVATRTMLVDALRLLGSFCTAATDKITTITMEETSCRN
jgi:hypothetical protein